MVLLVHRNGCVGVRLTITQRVCDGNDCVRKVVGDCFDDGGHGFVVVDQ